MLYGGVILQKLKKLCIVCLIVLALFLLIEQIFMTFYNSKIGGQSENLNAVYTQSIEFINDFYDKNAEDTYSQLREKNTCETNYKTKKDWSLTIFNDIGDQTLEKIVKPASSSDVSYIVHSNYPHETYLVQFSLSIDYLGKGKNRTGEIEYVSTDDGFKVYRFEIDVLDDSGRWVLY